MSDDKEDQDEACLKQTHMNDMICMVVVVELGPIHYCNCWPSQGLLQQHFWRVADIILHPPSRLGKVLTKPSPHSVEALIMVIVCHCQFSWKQKEKKRMEQEGGYTLDDLPRYNTQVWRFEPCEGFESLHFIYSSIVAEMRWRFPSQETNEEPSET